MESITIKMWDQKDPEALYEHLKVVCPTYLSPKTKIFIYRSKELDCLITTKPPKRMDEEVVRFMGLELVIERLVRV